MAFKAVRAIEIAAIFNELFVNAPCRVAPKFFMCVLPPGRYEPGKVFAARIGRRKGIGAAQKLFELRDVG
ncbi:hypothetical protein [Bradyrhizobium sp. RT4b]|uniref:hypothetical protein n=1 Tax=Bradyrhizobium sp. RT4b TaxID=3156379 RepID=UPI00339736F9